MGKIKGNHILLLIPILLGFFNSFAFSAESVMREFPFPLENYHDEHLTGLWEILKNRIFLSPFNAVSLAIFVMAIVHALLTNKIQQVAKHFEKKRNLQWLINEAIHPHQTFKLEYYQSKSFFNEMVYFFGVIEIVFGIWVIPLMIASTYYYDWDACVTYLNSRNFTEPVFVVVVMAFASTRPILTVVESFIKTIAQLFGKKTPQAWWMSILIVVPLLGSLITEPGAMTVGAILLGKEFYQLKPRKSFAYATLGLLFVNISIGGVLTNFAAPPILMVADKWNWSASFMFSHFGWKAILAIFTSNTLYFFLFRRHFDALEKRKNSEETEFSSDEKRSIPIWITLVHIFVLFWIVSQSHYPVLFLGAFIIFLGFYQSTSLYQSQINMKPPILVGFFLAGLIIHGGLQGWWIEPILRDLTKISIMVGTTVLTAFNDNAIITYLSTTVPDFPDILKYAVVSGAISGGGLTVIANAPNPAGRILLQEYFDDGISPLLLLCAALPPTILTFLIFLFL